MLKGESETSPPPSCLFLDIELGFLSPVLKLLFYPLFSKVVVWCNYGHEFSQIVE